MDPKYSVIKEMLCTFHSVAYFQRFLTDGFTHSIDRRTSGLHTNCKKLLKKFPTLNNFRQFLRVQTTILKTDSNNFGQRKGR